MRFYISKKQAESENVQLRREMQARHEQLEADRERVRGELQREIIRLKTQLQFQVIVQWFRGFDAVLIGG